MQPTDFLAAVLPSEGQGRYCAFELPAKRNTFCDDLPTLSNTTELLSLGNNNTFFALAIFHDKNRLAANALAVRSLWVDIDCGAQKDSSKTYTTKREAIQALLDFLKDTGLDKLGAPWLVDSGGGIHVYWPLTEDTCIEDWKPVAESMKYTAQRLGFKIDMTVTADAARVLRMPGTFNHKTNPPKPVVLKQRGDIFVLEDIAARLDKVSTPVPGKGTAISLPSMRPAGLPPMSATMQALTQNQVTLFKNIVVRTMAGTGCGQLQNYFENAQDDGMEPLYRGLLSIAKVCEDGQKACEKLTDAHPYTRARMQQKLMEIKGPYPCTKLDSENPGICGTCTHWGKITNPLALGREVAIDNEPKTFDVVDEQGVHHPGAHLKRPLPPVGYSFGARGGVYRQVTDTDSAGNISTRDVMILPYEFFLVDLLQENSTYTARFAVIRAKTVTYIVIPQKEIVKKDACISTLADQNVMASFGSGNDAHLAAYVRGAVEVASVADSALRIPPRYGWQPDHSFAVSDYVIQQRQNGQPHGYQFPSTALRNLINSTKTKGDLGEWQRYVGMCQAKGLWDILGFLGASFGSPLMEFAGAGTPAMMYHACGEGSGKGKTLALHLAASVWGSPTEYLIKPSTSERTMMQRAGMLGNLPMIVDEVTAEQRKSKGEFIPSLVFDFSQGGHKIKGSGSANAELINDLFWRANGIISSNEPAMEKMLTMRETTSFGELYRMLEWNATVELEWSEQEQLLKDILEHNHGHAGRVYAEYLVNNREVAQRVTVDCIAKVRKLMKSPDHERFYTAGVGANLAGLILAGPDHANIFDFDTKKIFKFAYAQWIFNARNLMSSNVQTAEDLLAAYVKEFHGKFVTLENGKGSMAMFQDNRNVTKQTTRGRVAGRIERDIRPGFNDFFIEIMTFKQYCGSRNKSYKSVVEDLKKTMIVTESRRDLLAKTGGPEMRVNCLHISTLIADEDRIDLIP